MNDACGHAAGNQLLIDLASRLQQHSRRGDVLLRPGGDEFGLLLANCAPEKAAQIAAELLDVLAISVSAGASAASPLAPALV